MEKDLAEAQEGYERYLVGLSFAHFVPTLVQLVDFCFVSAIEVKPKDLIGILLCALGYLAVHLIQTFWVNGRDEAPIYPSHDWYRHPFRAVLLTTTVFVLLVIVHLLMVRYSKWRIKTFFGSSKAKIRQEPSAET